jgi:hypothetical protein
VVHFEVTGDNGFARTRVVSQDVAQGLSRQHGFVDGCNLMRERLHAGGVHSHHLIEEEGEVDAFGLHSELEVLSIAIKGSGPFSAGHGKSVRVCLGN